MLSAELGFAEDGAMAAQAEDAEIPGPDSTAPATAARTEI
jgi:hypothetical protein